MTRESQRNLLSAYFDDDGDMTQFENLDEKLSKFS